MMRVEILNAAVAEQDGAAQYYDVERPGLGSEFLEELGRAVSLVRRSPEAWPKVSAHSRRCRLKRFPYAVVYQVKADAILIIAVTHYSRKPGYWLDRE